MFIKKTEGYSLAEVMVALVIFSIIMLGTASMMISSMQGNVNAQHTTSAYYQTQRVIDDIDFHVQQSPAYADSLVDLGQQQFQDGIYTIRYQMVNIDDETAVTAQIKQLTVTAEWQGTSGSRDVTTESLITVP